MNDQHKRSESTHVTLLFDFLFSRIGCIISNWLSIIGHNSKSSYEHKIDRHSEEQNDMFLVVYVDSNS